MLRIRRTRSGSSRSVIAMALISLAMAATSTDVVGGEMKSVSLYGDYKALSADPKYQWSAAYTFQTIDNQLFHASAVAIAPNVVIGPGHFTPSPTGTSIIREVIFGENYNSPSSLVMPVERWERYPGYTFGDVNTIDLAVYWLTDPIPGFDTHVTFTDAPLGEVLTQVGYGNYGDYLVGELPSVGDRLAGVGDVVLQDLFYPSSLYGAVRFDGPDSVFDLPTKGLQFDSGSAWYDIDGDLALLAIASSNGVDGSGYTFGLRLNHPDVQAYLQPIIEESWASVTVPEPSSLALFSFGAAWVILRYRRQRLEIAI